MTFTETNVDVAIEISLPLDFPEPDLLEVEGFNEIMEDFFAEEKIQEKEEACIKDLIDNLKKPLFRKSPINIADWKVKPKKKGAPIRSRIFK